MTSKLNPGMNHIPERFRRKIKEAKEQQLPVLDLSSTYNTDDQDKLTKIPDEVFSLTQLKVLKLTNNKINELPEAIGNLTNLQKLVLSDNDLRYLPIALYKLNELQWVDLKGNRLSYIPGIFKNLRWLDLRENEFLHIPEFIKKSTNLEQLYLEKNQLCNLIPLIDPV